MLMTEKIRPRKMAEETNLPLAGLLVLDDVSNLGVDLFKWRVQLLCPLHQTPRTRGGDHKKATDME